MDSNSEKEADLKLMDEFDRAIRSLRTLLGITCVIGVLTIIAIIASLFILSPPSSNVTQSSSGAKTDVVTSMLRRRVNSVNKSVDPCDNFYNYACGGFEMYSWDLFRTRLKTYAITTAILKSPSTVDEVTPLTEAKTYFKSCTNAKRELDIELIKMAIRNFTIPITSPGKSQEEDQHLVEKNVARILRNGLPSFLEINVGIANEKLAIDISKISTWETIQSKILTFSDPSELAAEIAVAVQNETMELNETTENESTPEFTFQEIVKELIYTKSSQYEKRFDWEAFFLELVEPSSHYKLLNGTFILKDAEFLRTTGLRLKNAPLIESLSVLESIAILALQNEPIDEQPFEYRGISLAQLTELQQFSLELRCDVETRQIYGMAIGSMYTKKIGYNEKKTKEIEHFLNTMIHQLKSTIVSLEWIDDKSKVRLLNKLVKLEAVLGYPDLSAMELTDLYSHIILPEDTSSYTRNKLQVLKSEAVKEWNDVLNTQGKDLGTVLNSSLLLNPMTINAMAFSQVNKIYIPASLFQQPFYDAQALPVFNYGSLGYIIAHEIMHQFDTKGIRRDAVGLKNETWLSEEFFSVFKNKSTCIEEQFEIPGNQQENETSPAVAINDGEATLDENIADNGGIRLAFDTIKDLDGKYPLEYFGYSHHQLFFLAFAQFHCTEDPFKGDGKHSYSELRVNGPLSNMPEFYEAWNCHIPERQMCRIW